MKLRYMFLALFAMMTISGSNLKAGSPPNTEKAFKKDIISLKNVVKQSFNQVPKGNARLLNFEFAYVPNDTVGAPLAGVVWTGTEYWLASWRSDTLARFDKDGVFKGLFKILDGASNISGIRAMTYDGASVYAVNNNSTKTVYKINPTTRVLISKTNYTNYNNGVASNYIRWITYDSTANSNAGGFWMGNYGGNIMQLSLTGTVLQTIPAATHGQTGMYGAVYDGRTTGGPYLWANSQGGNGCDIIPISLVAGPNFGKPLTVTQDVEADLGFPGGVAGGITIAPVVNGKRIIASVDQGVALIGYELSFLASDLSISEVDPSNSQSEWPIFQNAAVTFKGTVSNNTPNVLNNAALSVNISKNGGSLQTLNSVISTIAFETKAFTTASYTFPDTGFYLIRSVVHLTGDLDGSNDTTFSAVLITDSTYARDYWDFGLEPGFYGKDDSANTRAIFGQDFIINNSDDVTSVSALILPDKIGDTTRIYIYNTDANGKPTTVKGRTQKYTIVAADTAGIYITLPMEGGNLTLAPGKYFFGIQENRGFLGFGFTSRIYTAGYSWYNFLTGGTGGFVSLEGGGLSGSPVIQPNFGKTHTSTGIFNNKPLESLKIFPNPNDGDMKVTFNLVHAGDLQLSVSDVIGRIIYEQSVKAETGFNEFPLQLKSVPNGLYMIKASINGEDFLGRIIVNK